tara:strand:+ start:140 stop:442 length:303 start_codon:yes stop_codon:yes gene_type:complete
MLWKKISVGIVVCVALSLGAGCSSLRLGAKFKVDPASAIKIGHDTKKDVLHKLGQPKRRSVDTEGRVIFTYIWANGDGGGQVYTVAFNKNDIVYVVESSQ